MTDNNKNNTNPASVT